MIGGKVSSYINLWTVLCIACIVLTIILVIVFGLTKANKDKEIPSIHVWKFSAIIGGLLSTVFLVAGLIQRRKNIIKDHGGSAINIRPEGYRRPIIRPNAKKNLDRQDAMIAIADQYDDADVLGELYNE